MPTVLPPSHSIPQSGPGWEIADIPLIRRRAFISLLVLALAFFALLMRLYYLQVISGQNFASKAQSNRLRPVEVPAPRGLITDRNGVVLATSRSLHSVAIVPGLLPSARKQKAERALVIRNLAALLKIDAKTIEPQIAAALKRQGRYDAVPIKSDVALATIGRIAERRAELGAGVLVTDELRRVYPQGALFGHGLGYSGIVNERDLARAKAAGAPLGAFDRVGKSGIERQYNDLLHGEHGAQVFEVDATNRPIGERAPIAATPGDTLRLALDAKLQRVAEAALGRAKNNGAIAAIDPRNGEVLVLASRPTFNPNTFELPRAQFSAAYRKLLATPGYPLLNRAATSRFPPGSTFKMVSAAAGLQKGVIDPNWTVNCAGGYKIGGRRFGCWKTHGRGVNLNRAIAESCDVYFYEMSLRLGNSQGSGPTYLAQTARKFGLGSDSGIDLPSDEAGLIPDPAWLRRVNAKHPDYARWMPGNTLNMSIGQGDVLATPLQMALATGAIANGGTLWKPHLLREHRGADGKPQRFAIAGKSIGISRQNVEFIRQGMRQTVTNGTGKPGALPNVAVAGKTGSAEDANKVLPHSWWVCFAPYDKPTIAIAVLVENAGHGSDNALPIAREILQARFPLPVAPPAGAIAPAGAAQPGAVAAVGPRVKRRVRPRKRATRIRRRR